jgi:SAM-dependent methyltransferase
VVDSPAAETTWGSCADLYDLEWDPWTPRDLPFYLEEARRRPPVLDLACGTGRLTVPIARAGLAVVGVDASAEMLEVARRKAVDLPQLELVHGRIETVDLQRQFGTIMLALSSFCCLASVEAQERALQNMRRHLRPGGRLVMDMFVPSAAHLGQPLTGPPAVDGARLVARLSDPVTGHVHLIWEAAHHIPNEQVYEVNRVIQTFDGRGRSTGDVRHFWLRDRYVHRFEMQHLLRLSGFEVVDLYGGFDREPFGASSRRMVWIATPAARVDP